MKRNITDIESYDVKIIKEIFYETDDALTLNKHINKIIDFFNEGAFDFSIHRFDDIEKFKMYVNDFDTLSQFHEFYKSVDSDLTDTYYITEMGEITFIESTEKLLETILVINSTLSREEIIELHCFLVENFY